MKSYNFQKKLYQRIEIYLMRVKIDLNKRRYMFDFLKIIFYDSVRIDLKIVFLLTIVYYLIDFLDTYDIIIFFQTYISYAKYIEIVLLSYLIGMSTYILMSNFYKFNELRSTLSKTSCNTLEIILKNDEIKIFQDDILSKSSKLNDIKTFQYIHPTIYLISNENEIFIQINEKDVISNNFHEIIDFFKSRWQ